MKVRTSEYWILLPEEVVVAIPIPSGEGQNFMIDINTAGVQSLNVAIPIPSGEGQNYSKCYRS